MVGGIVLSGLIVVLATAVYTLLVWWADRHEKEPMSLLALALFWGAVPAVFLSLVGEVIFDAQVPGATLGMEVLRTGLVGPIIEEVAKGLMIFLLFRFRRLEFDGPVDGIVYGAVVGFGFAMTENFLYFVSTLEEGFWAWSFVVILRQVVFGLNHAFFTAWIGLGFGLARLRRGRARWLYPLGGFLLAVAFHAWHNTTLTLAQVTWLAFVGTLVGAFGGVLMVVVILVLALARERRWMREELAEEVGTTLSAEEYAQLQGYRPWRWGDGKAGRRLRALYHLAAELALKKRQLRRAGEDEATRLRIAQLRAQIATLQDEERAPNEGAGPS